MCSITIFLSVLVYYSIIFIAEIFFRILYLPNFYLQKEDCKCSSAKVYEKTFIPHININTFISNQQWNFSAHYGYRNGKNWKINHENYAFIYYRLMKILALYKYVYLYVPIYNYLKNLIL